jgi:hypothetical protein
MANTGRMNLLEEEGRIKSEPQTKNVKAEEKRVVGEIKKGYKTGGRVALAYGSKPASSKNTSAGAVLAGKKVGCQIV